MTPQEKALWEMPSRETISRKLKDRKVDLRAGVSFEQFIDHVEATIRQIAAVFYFGENREECADAEQSRNDIAALRRILTEFDKLSSTAKSSVCGGYELGDRQDFKERIQRTIDMHLKPQTTPHNGVSYSELHIAECMIVYIVKLAENNLRIKAPASKAESRFCGFAGEIFSFFYDVQVASPDWTRNRIKEYLKNVVK